ncbi:MAG TPA: biopolymer transporter ExbD [Candidatus Baltobacteraceae bacterium]|nr:biopolymer transporter ExbD [Candidatus Baltobacteraceae bacterium]
MSLLSAQQESDVMAEINITPFTDVLLVLLIIFMILAALVTPPGFEKELPNKSNSTSTQNNPKNDIEVVVNAKGVIYVDGQQTNAKGIYRVMTLTAIKRPHKHVSITADEKAPYGIIITILDAAQNAGLNDVGFVTS